jgi:hypothetical protein
MSSKDTKDSECPICLQELDEAGQPTHFISCGHKVHYSCMREYAKSNGYAMCPFDRIKMPEFDEKKKPVAPRRRHTRSPERYRREAELSDSDSSSMSRRHRRRRHRRRQRARGRSRSRSRRRTPSLSRSRSRSLSPPLQVERSRSRSVESIERPQPIYIRSKSRSKSRSRSKSIEYIRMVYKIS